jgi:hypothetical protein
MPSGFRAAAILGSLATVRDRAGGARGRNIDLTPLSRRRAQCATLIAPYGCSLDRSEWWGSTMALELRPNCECCDKDLPPSSPMARICSYECTFCADCVEGVLFNVCPNCGGGFTPRPIRPATEWRPGLSIAKRPPSTKPIRLSYNLDEIAAHSNRIKHIPPEDR